MTLPLTADEAALVHYALKELAHKRLEQALDGRKQNSEWADANEREARQLFSLANRVTVLASRQEPQR